MYLRIRNTSNLERIAILLSTQAKASNLRMANLNWRACGSSLIHRASQNKSAANRNILRTLLTATSDQDFSMDYFSLAKKIISWLENDLTEHGAGHRSSRVIYDRFDSAFSKATPSMFDWKKILQGAAWFHWSGITPAISKGAAETCYEAVRAARKSGIKISADINYRRNLWNYGKQAIEVMPELIAESDIMIGGLSDFENCMGIQSNDFEEGCRKVQKKFPSVSMIANTNRETIQSTHHKISSKLWNGSSL